MLDYVNTFLMSDSYPTCPQYHRAVEVLANICHGREWSLHHKLLACPLRTIISRQHHRVRVDPELRGESSSPDE
jgi:hypothetical protein